MKEAPPGGRQERRLTNPERRPRDWLLELMGMAVLMPVLGLAGYIVFSILGMGHDGWNPSEDDGRAGAVLCASVGFWIVRRMARRGRRRREARRWAADERR